MGATVIIAWWGIVAIGLLGWGRLLLDRALPDEPPRNAAAIAVGSALAIVAGSVHSLARFPSPLAFWIGFTVTGCALAVVALRDPSRRAEPFPVLPFAVASLLFLPRFLALLNDTRFNCYDDDLAYLPHLKMLLSGVPVDDPFSLRRLASFTGQQILQSLFVAPGGMPLLKTIDLGLFPWLAIAQIFELSRRFRAPDWAALLLAIAFAGWPYPSINTAPHLTPLPLLVALAFLLLPLEKKDPTPRPAWILAVALVSAAVVDLRANYVVGVGAILASAFLAAYGGLGKPARAVGLGIAALALLVLPGAIAMRMSSGTFFFPIWNGNYHPEFDTFGSTAREALRFLADSLSYSGVWSMLALIALCSVKDGVRSVTFWLGTAYVALFSITAMQLASTEDWNASHRYSFPFLCVALFVAFLRTAAARRERKLAAVAAIAFLGLHAVDVEFQVEKFWVVDREFATKTLRSGPATGLPDLARAAAVQLSQAQAAVPAGRPILSAVERPYLLDYRRNPIHGIDIPGLASPKAPIPFEGGDAAIDRYFLSLGYEYLLLEDPEKAACQYRLATWQEAANKKLARAFRAWGPLHLAFLGYSRRKAASSDRTGTFGPYSVVRLRSSGR